MDPATWPTAVDDLDTEQRRLAALDPERWSPAHDALRVGGVFLAFASGQQGPGHAGDQAWVGAVTVRCPGLEVLEQVVRPCTAGAAYDPGHLALREGPALGAAVAALADPPDVLLVDATGRDHPRGAGLALHLGAVLDLPTIGVTHRPLRAVGPEPDDEPGARSPLRLDGETVGFWVRIQRGVRPIAVHAAWRVDADTAVEVVLRCRGRARTPEPLRRARAVARVARARAEGRAPP